MTKNKSITNDCPNIEKIFWRMPTHWESSKRPLFVRTVVVNGSRHAILTEEDPLCQNTNSGNKQSRPSSPPSSRTSSSYDGRKEQDTENFHKGANKSQGDLQACLVKLRLVLTSQENRKSIKVEKKQVREVGNKKKRKTSILTGNEKTCEWHASTLESTELNPTTEVTENISEKYDQNHNVTVATFFNQEPRIHCCHQTQDNNIERIVGHTDYPQPEYSPYSYYLSSSVSALGIASEYDHAWNKIPSDNYFTRPFYNRLSERVLQWLDLSSRKAKDPENSNKLKPETKIDNKRRHSKTLRKFPTTECLSSEDNSDEVRTDEDIETVLSKECPKYSQDLNRLHYLKSAIPAKEETLSTQLQESITQSFTTVVTRSDKLSDFPKTKLTSAKILRKGYLTRQIRLEETSDDEEETKSKKQWRLSKQNDLINNEIFTNFKSKQIRNESEDRFLNKTIAIQNKLPWLRDCKWPAENEVTKPQLHIFMPALPDCETVSDSASLCSDA